jgi:hypothetical protein
MSGTGTYLQHRIKAFNLQLFEYIVRVILLPHPYQLRLDLSPITGIHVLPILSVIEIDE